jgi:type VI secretion system Hcp family effector
MIIFFHGIAKLQTGRRLMNLERSRAFKILFSISVLIYLTFFLLNRNAFSLENDVKDNIPQCNIFVKVEGIPGESLNEDYRDWIEANYLSSGVIAGIQRSARGRRAAAKARFDSIEINKMFDKASPLLFQYCADGRNIKNVKIVLTNPNIINHKHIELYLEDVLVNSVNAATDSSFEGMIESVKFIFGKILWRYYLTNPTTGEPEETIVRGWDLKANEPTNEWPSDESLSNQKQSKK